jgi:ABC-type uncharacterized transport system YnjBCD substrate-binding protein
MLHPASRESGRRRRAAVAAAGVLALLVTGCGAPSSGGGGGVVDPTSVPDRPGKAVHLNILDIAGNLQLTQGMIDNFVHAHPDIVSGVTYTRAPAPSMAGRLQSEQQGGTAQTHLVLSGTDGLSAGIATNTLAKLLPDYQGRFPGLMGNYQPPAAAMQQLSGGYGIELVYYPSGPLLEYRPEAVGTPPTSPAELLAWAKAHPGRFQYANPANSGPGRTFLMGLPYLLGDSDPKDPVNGWTKTWAYLAELGRYTGQYASGTTETMKNLASGTVDMVASTTGWDINPRALHTVPNTVRVTPLQPMHWVTDAQYALIPKGVSADVLAADLQLIHWMLQPDQQAIAYDKGYFYPGPAVRGVTLQMAPAASQDTLRTFGRPEYADWIARYPTETSLPATAQVAAFDRWNRLVGSKK